MAVTSNAVGNSPVTRRGVVISRSALKVCAAILVGVIALAAYLLWPRGSNVERGTLALIDAFSKRRFIEPRLSGGFNCGEFRPARDETSDIKTNRLDRARELITDAVATGDAPAQLAYARLLLSEDRKLPDALKYLRKVLAASAESAEAHNDLGVCLIQTGKLEDAIDEFHNALELKADLPEALFNRGLCYQRLLLREPALADFNRVSEIERDRRWLDEIKRRIDEVSRPPAPQKTDLIAEFDAALADGSIDEASMLADQNSELVRRHAIWDVTIQQLQAAVDGDHDKAERALFEIDLISGALIKNMNDSMTADTARYLRSLPDSERQRELDLIRDYVQTVGRLDLNNDKKVTFERLENQFRDRGNLVFETLSAFQVADYFYGVKRFGDSGEKIKKILNLVESRDWPYYRARFLCVLALDTSLLGQDSLAIKYFDQATSLCGKSPELQSKLLQYMSVPYFQLGNVDAALACLRDSTRLVPENALRSRMLANLAHNYSQIASIYSLRNQHSLALLYAGQALDYSQQSRDVNYAAEYSSFIAVEHARLNQFDDAEDGLKRALDYVGKIDAGRPRDFTEALVLINAGEVAARHADLPRALGCYERAEPLVLRDANKLPMIKLLHGRAEAYIASSQNERAQSDLMRAVSLIENYRSYISTSDQRSHFLDASHGVYDQLISLDIDALARPSEAFEMSERSRARALLEEISREGGAAKHRSPHASSQSYTGESRSPGMAKPLRLGEVQSQLPDDLTLLEYSVTSKGTYLFVVKRSGFKTLKLPAATEVLERLVHDYVLDLRQLAPLDEVTARARALYDYLIKPAEGDIGGNMNLCIVPDKALHFLPFAGLVDRSNKYLIESRRLTYAPSASVLAQCIREARAKPADRNERILAVGNPQFSGESFPNLPPLVDAEREASVSASFYKPTSLVLTGAEATERRVRAAMTECDVAHLALHCVVEERSPWLAALVLARTSPAQGAVPLSESVAANGPPTDASRADTIKRTATLTSALAQEPVTDSGDGLLYLSELYDIKLPRTRLVVLSACQSGLGQYYRGEGIVSLVRPFLAVGVPTVMASLWAVDSRATSDLMIEFHRQRKVQNLPAGDALRMAQIEMARSGLYQHPYYWAPFIVVGTNLRTN